MFLGLLYKAKKKADTGGSAPDRGEAHPFPIRADPDTRSETALAELGEYRAILIASAKGAHFGGTSKRVEDSEGVN